jgi:hypothetical protein
MLSLFSTVSPVYFSEKELQELWTKVSLLVVTVQHSFLPVEHQSQSCRFFCAIMFKAHF